MKQGRVVTLTRRHVILSSDDDKQIRCQVYAKHMHIAIGDIVEYAQTKEGFEVTEILPRKNCLIRSSGSKTKTLGANLDRVLIMTAPGALYNTEFIDRVSTACALENIPITLLVNKIDLLPDEAVEIKKMYAPLLSEVFLLSAKRDLGIDLVRKHLLEETNSVVLITGVSGVGKSSLLNRLIPQASQEVGEVTRKTGQGKQTTSQAFGYFFATTTRLPLLVIDTPGVQNFALVHVPEEKVILGFPEIERRGMECPFLDCSHLNEEICAVKEAVRSGEISPHRYASYLKIKGESRAAERPWE